MSRSRASSLGVGVKSADEIYLKPHDDEGQNAGGTIQMVLDVLGISLDGN
jgi:hypothetical protein